MAYTKTTWLSGTAPFINADNLNNIEDGVFDTNVIAENLSTAISDTGTVNNLVVDTIGTFDLTKNKNVTPFIIPLFTNTSGTVNINLDGQGNKLIKKANDTGTLVALEAGDIKKNVPTQLVWDSVSDFFIFAPKGGEKFGILTISSGTTSTDTTTQRVNYTGKGVFKSVFNSETASYKWYVVIDSVRYPSSGAYLTSSTKPLLFFNIPFKTSFQFYSDEPRMSCTYEEDGKCKTPFNFSPTSLTSPKVSVTGKGKIKGTMSFGSGQQLFVDGVRVIGTSDTSAYTISGVGLVINVEFGSSFQYYAESTSGWAISYELY